MQAFGLQPASLVLQEVAGNQVTGGMGHDNAVIVAQSLLTDLSNLLVGLLRNLAFHPAVTGPVDARFGAVQPVIPPVVFSGLFHLLHVGGGLGQVFHHETVHQDHIVARQLGLRRCGEQSACQRYR